jgi:hypothetical protein
MVGKSARSVLRVKWSIQPESGFIHLNRDVLDQIDSYAEREGFTRPGFLAQAKKAMPF